MARVDANVLRCKVMGSGEPLSKFGSFVGRERELGELRHGLAEAREGHGRLFLLSGEPGIGKTRLAEECAREATARGMRAVWGRCWEGDGAPAYWPWIQILRGCLAPESSRSDRSALQLEHLAPAVAAVAQIVPELRSLAPHPDKPLTSDPEQARFQLFDSVAAMLGAFARSAPLAIVLDDLHDADDASLSLLKFVARGLVGLPILIIGTYREAEVRRSADLAGHLGKLNREARSIALVGLSAAEVGQFLAERSGKSIAATMAAHLRESTGGNPLFVDGVVRMMIARGGLDIGFDKSIEVPHALDEAIRTRLARLSKAARSILDVAAVIGNEFEARLCAKARELPVDEMRPLLDEVAAEGLLTPLAENRYRFAHSLIRGALYDSLESGARRCLHAKVGEAIEELHSKDLSAHLADLAHHYRAVGGNPKAIDYSIRAGETAAAVFAFTDAAAHLHAALELMEQQGASEAERADLLHRLGGLWFAIDRAKAVPFLESAIALYERIGCVEKAARLHVLLGINFSGHERSQISGTDSQGLDFEVPVLSLCDSGFAVDHFRQAESVLSKGPETAILSRLYAGIAFLKSHRMELADGWTAAQRAGEIADRMGDKAACIYAAEACAWFLVMSGRLTEGFTLYRRAFQDAVQANASGLASVWMAGWYCFCLHDPREARAWYELEWNRPSARTAPRSVRHLRHLMGLALIEQGKFDEVRRLGEEHIGIRLWEAGEWETVAALEEKGVELAERTGDGFARFNWGISLGPIYQLLGDYRRAETHLLHGLDNGSQGPVVFQEMRARPLLAALYVAMNRLDAASAQLTRCQEIMAAGEDWRGLAGNVARAQGMLAAAQRDYDLANRGFGAALAVHRKFNTPWLQADTLRSWGDALAAAGDRARAAEKFDAAAEIYRSRGASNRFVEHVMAEKARALGPGITAAAASTPSGIFKSEGEFWTIAYQGASFRLKNIKGLTYMAFLLAHPGERFHSRDLAAIVEGAAIGRNLIEDAADAGLSVVGDLDGAAPDLDPSARADYHRRLSELKDELDEAERFNDIGRAARIREELDFLGRELASAAGIGGRPRQSRSHAERARLMVGKNIRVAIQKIRRENPALARHLTNTIKTGYFCWYEPDRDQAITWQL